jgi:hemerythrin-like domain-containing protein
MTMNDQRRRFLITAAALGVAGFAFAAPGGEGAGAGSRGQTRDASGKKKGEHGEAGVAAPEDLMREHGVLNRILLVYEEGVRRLENRKEVAPEVFQKSAGLVRRFVEDYHEKLEEKHIFPEFEKQKQLVSLVKVLLEQHDAGRRVTQRIMSLSAPGQFGNGGPQMELAAACTAFIRMYRPHEAREDTVLFPAWRRIVSPARIAELGEEFEEEEERLFGEGGFDKIVGQVAEIEKQLGIYELDQFTPRK